MLDDVWCQWCEAWVDAAASKHGHGEAAAAVWTPDIEQYEYKICFKSSIKENLKTLDSDEITGRSYDNARLQVRGPPAAGRGHQPNRGPPASPVPNQLEARSAARSREPHLVNLKPGSGWSPGGPGPLGRRHPGRCYGHCDWARSRCSRSESGMACHRVSESADAMLQASNGTGPGKIVAKIMCAVTWQPEAARPQAASGFRRAVMRARAGPGPKPGSRRV